MGFDALEETIFQSMNQYQGPVILKGPAGAGKSSLAHSVVEALIKQNPPDELLWITLDYPTPYGGLLALTAGRAGLTLPPDEPVEEKELLLAYYLNRQKTLLVIDQAEHLEDMEATLTRFHQVAQGIQLIVVTRIWPINELPAQIYVVPSLTQEESIKLARRYIRQKRFPVLDDDQIEKMAMLGNGNPRLLLAIVEQSSYLPVSIIEERLSSSSDPERQLLHLHQATWDMLDGLSKRLLFQLALAGSDTPLTWAEIDMGWNKAANDLQRALQQLVEVSWLNFDPLAQRYTLPPLVKNYVLLQAEQPDNNALIGDILTGRQEPLTNSDDWAADQLQTFGIVARHVDDPGRLKALIAARAANIHRTGNWVGWRGVLLDILNRLDELDDKLPLAYIYREIGISARWLGELQEAEKALEKAVVLFGELEDFIAQGGVLIENGQLYQLQGQTLKAFDLYRWVKEMGDLYGEPALYVRAMRGLIELALSNKQTQAAIELANELVSSPFHGEMDGMLNSTLGMVMLQEGRLQQAQEYHQIAVEWFLDQDDFPNLARALMRKGMASHAAGSREAAAEDLQVALNMMRFMRDAYGEARALTNLGSIYAGHNPEEAKKCWTDGLQLQIRLGDTIGAIYSRYNLLDMFWEDMNPDDACREFRELSFLATQYQQVFVIDALRSHPLAGDPRCS
jgi:tetratricopeptide (TPR) repeat protein